MSADSDLVIRGTVSVFSPNAGPREHDVTILVAPNLTEASFGEGLVLEQGDTLVLPLPYMPG